MPGMDESAGAQLIAGIESLVDLNDLSCSGTPRSLSIGCGEA